MKPLTFAQFRVLYKLVEEGGGSLEQPEWVSAGGLTTLGALRKHGYVESVSKEKAGRHVMLTYLTNAGVAAYEEAYPRFAKQTEVQRTR